MMSPIKGVNVASAKYNIPFTSKKSTRTKLKSWDIFWA